MAGSNKQKESVIQAGIVPRLLHLFTENAQDGQLVYEIGKKCNFLIIDIIDLKQNRFFFLRCTTL